MEGAIIGRCTNNDITASIPIFGSTPFSKLCNQITSKFPDLGRGEFELTYALLGYSTCLLQSDMDVRMLHWSVTKENLCYVDILIRRRELDGIRGSSQQECNSEPFLAEGNTYNDGDEFLGKFRTPTPKMYLSHPWKSYISQIGQSFEGGVIEFRQKLCMYAAEMGFEFVYTSNGKRWVTTVCNKKYLEDCQWRVHASICRTCSVLVEELRANPHVKPIQIVDQFKSSYGLDISYWNAWFGKELAKKEVLGDDILSYQQLVWYLEAVKKTNPGSHCVLECESDTSRFHRLFIAFGGSVAGFKFCRPLLFLDATFVKNKYKGNLLVATGKNGNQGFFPLAFALVDAEIESNWTWFCEVLSDMLSQHQRTITFVLDRHKGLLESVSKIFPTSPHGYCILHIKKNILAKYPVGHGKDYRKKIVRMFNDCAYAVTPDEFEVNRETLVKEEGRKIKELLEELPPKNYSNAFFPGPRYGEMWSNVAELFNSWIRNERLLPVFQLVDGIRVKLMEMNSARHLVAENWTTHLCPEIEAAMEVGRHWHISKSSENVFEVHSDNSVMVDLGKWYCSCRKWQVDGFPCSHALQVIMKVGTNPFEYIEDYFTAAYYKSSYSYPIVPIPHIDKPPNDVVGDFVIRPPLTRKQPRKPKVNRIQ